MGNLLIGAISGNYGIEDIENWVSTSVFEGVHRALVVYNSTFDIEKYLVDNNIEVIKPLTDFWRRDVERFDTNTGAMNLVNSYTLVHNIRFLHIWKYLTQKKYNNVIITDVRDVYFNSNPFENITSDKLVATSEVITYNSEDWNRQHLYENLGEIGLELLLDKPVYNVGVFGGPCSLVADLCADIYLLSVGKPKVADQTSFNYLVQTKYKDVTDFTSLADKFAVHLHVINAGLVPFELSSVKEYKIVHQYDRIKGFTR